MTKRVRAYARRPGEFTRLQWAGCAISRHPDFIINCRMRSRVKGPKQNAKGLPRLRSAGGLQNGRFDQLPELFTMVICVSPLFSLADWLTVTVTELAPFCIVIIPPAPVVMVCALGPALSL